MSLGLTLKTTDECSQVETPSRRCYDPAATTLMNAAAEGAFRGPGGCGIRVGTGVSHGAD